MSHNSNSFVTWYNLSRALGGKNDYKSIGNGLGNGINNFVSVPFQ